MRTGPKPLPFQLAMASLASAGMTGGGVFDAVTLQHFFAGIQKYQKHPFKRPMSSLDVFWQKGGVVLRRAKGKRDNENLPVLLVPSMINSSDILDLLPDHSFMSFFNDNGFDAYLLDWGKYGQEGAPQSIDEAMAKYLIPALLNIGRPAIILGYCMGGLLAAAVAAIRPDLVKGCILLATPWDFHDETGALKARLSMMQPMAMPYIKQHGRLPDSWLQAVFASLDPESSIRKFADFAKMAETDPKAMLFVAVEDWLNDGIDLPAAIADTCINAWYGDNLVVRGEWPVCGIRVRAKDIACPTLTVCAAKDKIVPKNSALAFANQHGKADVIIYDGGHISLIAGKNAVRDAWRPIANWCNKQV